MKDNLPLSHCATSPSSACIWPCCFLFCCLHSVTSFAYARWHRLLVTALTSYLVFWLNSFYVLQLRLGFWELSCNWAFRIGPDLISPQGSSWRNPYWPFGYFWIFKLGQPQCLRWNLFFLAVSVPYYRTCRRFLSWYVAIFWSFYLCPTSSRKQWNSCLTAPGWRRGSHECAMGQQDRA